jgi:hypothetical protein
MFTPLRGAEGNELRETHRVLRDMLRVSWKLP